MLLRISDSGKNESSAKDLTQHGCFIRLIGRDEFRVEFPRFFRLSQLELTEESILITSRPGSWPAGSFGVIQWRDGIPLPDRVSGLRLLP